MLPQVVVGLGTGQCGFDLLTSLLQKQVGSRVTIEESPVLPWRATSDAAICKRIERWKALPDVRLVGDASSFYLPYVEQAIECDPSIRMICLERPRDEVVRSFCRSLDVTRCLAIDHWSETLGEGWSRDPIWSQAFPQYPASDRETAVGLYWDDYQRCARDFMQRFPKQFLIIDASDLTAVSGVKRVLDFIGISRSDQIQSEAKGTFVARGPEETPKPTLKALLDPSRCVILVPYNGFIHAECEESLKELERRGYTVRRVGGYAAIDQGRNQMATDALVDGFEETLWIDANIGFFPDDVERLRTHAVPIVSGVYPQKGKRSIASHVIPGTSKVMFGEAGGLTEMLYVATGFLLVRRNAYLTIQQRMQLPVCNERFGRPTIPFFLPMIRPIEDGHWYLAEDYAFCERARLSGIPCYADTRIRLWHIGLYRYGWEDAGIDRQRFSTFNLDVSGQ